MYGSGASDVVKAGSSSWTVGIPSLRPQDRVCSGGLQRAHEERSVKLSTIGILSSVASPTLPLSADLPRETV